MLMCLKTVQETLMLKYNTRFSKARFSHALHCDSIMKNFTFSKQVLLELQFT